MGSWYSSSQAGKNDQRTPVEPVLWGRSLKGANAIYKFEYRSTKFETIPNDQNSNNQNVLTAKTISKKGLLGCLELLNIRNSNLFRISTCPPMPLCSGCFRCIAVWKRNRHSTLHIKGNGRRVFGFRIWASVKSFWFDNLETIFVVALLIVSIRLI